jgi:NADH-quinone oxidoreductase subunit F
VSNPVITAGHLDVALSYEAFEAVGSGLGAGGFIVYDDTACMVEVAGLFSRFLWVESCGQCPACKLGSGEITERLQRIQGGGGVEHDLEDVIAWLGKVTDGNRCYLPVEDRLVVESILRAFPDEFAAHLGDGCPRPRGLALPKIVDLADGRVVYDERQSRKQPDWTYAAP